MFSAFLHESGHDVINFRGASIDHLVFVESAIKHNIFFYDVGELAKSVEMYEENVNALHYNNHIWMILTNSLNDSVAPVAIRSFRKREISTTILKRVKIEYIFTQIVCMHWAKPYLINLTDLEFFTTMLKNYSKTWLFLTLNLSVSH